MKILIFSENYWRGGMDSFIRNLLDAWPNRDDEFVVCCNADHPGLVDLKMTKNQRVSIQPHNKKTFVSFWKDRHYIFKTKLFRPFQVAIRYCFFFKNIFDCLSILKQQDSKKLLIINGSYPGGDSCRACAIANYLFFKRKSIHNFHNEFYSYPFILWPSEGLIDWFVRQSTSLWVTVSKNCALSKVKRWHFSQTPVSFINNGLPELDCLPLENKSKEMMVLVLANYEERKGHTFLLEAFSEVLKLDPGIKLVCSGHTLDQEFKQRLYRLIDKLGIHSSVELRDFTTQPNELIGQASFLIQPSVHSESFGLVLVEAMRLKKPIIATKVGGMPSILEGWADQCLVSPGDSNALADAIISLVNDRELIKKIGEEGFLVFKSKFTATRMAQEYEKVIKENL